MAKPSFSFSTLVLLGSCLFLTSCLELKVTVNFRSASTGSVEIDALNYRLAKGLTWENLTFPSTREEWTNVVLQSPGMSLTSWELVPDDLGTRSKTVLGFSTTRALESLLVSFKQKLTLLQDVQGRWNLTLAPVVPKLSTAAAETRKLWINLWGDASWKFTFLPVGSVSGFTYSMALRDLAAEKPLPEWKVSW